MQHIIVKYSNLFKLIYSIHIYPLNSTLSSKYSNKHSLLQIIVSLHTLSSKSLEKQQRDTLLSDRLEIKGLGICIAKESPTPSSRKLTRVPWVYKSFVDLSRAPRLVTNSTTV